MQKRTLSYKCPYCSKELDVDVVLSINASSDQHEKERLMSADLFYQHCEYCQHDFLLQVPFTYVDKERKFVIVLSVAEILPKEVMQTGKDLDHAGYKLRHVQTIQQLIEKIQIFEDGLDDRLVELAKYDHFIEFIDNKKGKPSDITSIEYQKVENGVMKINIRTGDSGMAFLTPLNLIEEEFKMDKDRLSIYNASYPKIDQKWIVSVYKPAAGKA